MTPLGVFFALSRRRISLPSITARALRRCFPDRGLGRGQILHTGHDFISTRRHFPGRHCPLYPPNNIISLTDAGNGDLALAIKPTASKTCLRILQRLHRTDPHPHRSAVLQVAANMLRPTHLGAGSVVQGTDSLEYPWLDLHSLCPRQRIQTSEGRTNNARQVPR